MKKETDSIPPGFYRGVLTHVSLNPSGTRLTTKVKLDNGLRLRSVSKLPRE